MSRNTVCSSDGRYVAAFGKDHACGWFIQIFDRESEDKETPIVDKDAVFDGLTIHSLIEIATTYNVSDRVQAILYGIE